MSKEFEYLKANEKYAQYWCRELVNSPPIPLIPKKHSYRSIYACDRDRVMYSSAFRRLSSKTQVFNSQLADNLRTRLTHTLEVAQIARTLACQLGLDEELTEAIALGHDVGHTPFGHIGERTLNKFSQGKDKRQIAEKISVKKEHYGFKHNLQSVRVLVEYSEGVKFSNYMLFGIREHSKLYWDRSDDVAFYDMYIPYCSYNDGDKNFLSWSFEAFLVKWADEVAQRHHDIEDAFLQKIMSANDIVEKVEPLANLINDENLTHKYERLKEEADKITRKDSAAIQYAFVHTLSSFLVDTYVTILKKEFARKFRHFSNIFDIKNQNDFIDKYLTIPIEKVREMMSLNDAKIYQVDMILGQNLKYSILDSHEVQRMDGKGAYVIRKLVRAYMSNPQQLPNGYINRFIKVELVRTIGHEMLNELIQQFKEGHHYDFPNNINIWKDYECREVLRAITENNELMNMVYDALLRVVFDYISGMTDSYATTQRIELY